MANTNQLLLIPMQHISSCSTSRNLNKRAVGETLPSLIGLAWGPNRAYSQFHFWLCTLGFGNLCRLSSHPTSVYLFETLHVSISELTACQVSTQPGKNLFFWTTSASRKHYGDDRTYLYCKQKTPPSTWRTRLPDPRRTKKMKMLQAKITGFSDISTSPTSICFGVCEASQTI